MRPWRAAALGVALQVAWLAAVAGDHEVTLAVSHALDAAGAPARLVDVAVLLPLLALGAGALAAMRPRRRGPAVLLASASLALAAGFEWQRELVLHRFVAVEEGVLYRAGQMSEAALDDALARHGIRTLVFLRRPGESLERERALAASRDVAFMHVPMADPGAAVPRFLEVMDDAERHPVLVHCQYGVARTGLLSAVYRMEYHGWDVRRALREARLLSGFEAFDADSHKREFLLTYRPRSPSATRSGAESPGPDPR